jgi:hypothetical protein
MIHARVRAALRCAAYCLFSGVLTVVGACSKLEDQFAVDVAFSERTGGRQVTLPGDMPTFDLTTDCMPADLTYSKDEKKFICEKPTMLGFDGSADDAKLAFKRNRFQDYLIWRSEQQCERHKAAILSTQSSTNFVLNTVTTGVAAVGAIVVAPATNILSAIAAISSGTRSHFNEDFYRQFLAPAVVKRINIDRSNKYAEIMGKRGLQVIERPPGTVTSTESTVGSTTTTTSTEAKPATTAKPPTPSTTVTTVTSTATPSRIEVNYAGTRRIVLLRDYSMEEALADVEKYHQLCSFSSGLASLVNPGEKYEDTAKGIQARIDALRDMQTANEKQAAYLMQSGGNDGKIAAKRLRETNEDISRQIMVLQHRMLTAPMTVDSKPTGG